MMTRWLRRAFGFLPSAGETVANRPGDDAGSPWLAIGKDHQYKALRWWADWYS